MIEFNVKIRVNTQDPDIAHEHLRAALAFTGLEVEVSDNWMKNNQYLPKQAAQRTAMKWMRGRTGPFDNNVTMSSNDPAYIDLMTSLTNDAVGRSKWMARKEDEDAGS